jgi:hypothetical protein
MISTLTSSLLLILATATVPSPSSEPASPSLDLATPPLDLAFTYHTWLTAIHKEEWARAASLVVPDELQAFRDRAIAEIESLPGRRMQKRLYNLGLLTLEELEALTPTELFTRALQSGGNILPHILRSSTVEVAEGATEGDQGWLRIRLTPSAQGGEITASSEILQGFRAIEGIWYVSLQPVAGPGESEVPLPATEESRQEHTDAPAPAPGDGS